MRDMLCLTHSAVAVGPSGLKGRSSPEVFTRCCW